MNHEAPPGSVVAWLAGLIDPQWTASNPALKGYYVRADSNLSHRADSILSQGWKPTLRPSAVDKCRSLSGSLRSSMLC
jgi:hypothetical protein